jgi:hypothetical protein
LDRTLGFTDDDLVPDLKWPQTQNQNPAHEVRNDVLERKAQCQARQPQAGHDRLRLETERVGRHENADRPHQVVGDLLQQILDGQV